MTHLIVIIYTIVATYLFLTYVERKFHVAQDVARDLNAE